MKTILLSTFFFLFTGTLYAQYNEGKLIGKSLPQVMAMMQKDTNYDHAPRITIKDTTTYYLFYTTVDDMYGMASFLYFKDNVCYQVKLDARAVHLKTMVAQFDKQFIKKDNHNWIDKEGQYKIFLFSDAEGIAVTIDKL